MELRVVCYRSGDELRGLYGAGSGLTKWEDSDLSPEREWRKCGASVFVLGVIMAYS